MEILSLPAHRSDPGMLSDCSHIRQALVRRDRHTEAFHDKGPIALEEIGVLKRWISYGDFTSLFAGRRGTGAEVQVQLNDTRQGSEFEHGEEATPYK
jgi:hypothetical protein